MSEYRHFDQSLPAYTITKYSYDALGNRRSKTVELYDNSSIDVTATTTYYLNAPIFGMSHVIAELAEDMTIKSSYVYAGPQLLKEEPSTTDRSLDLYMLHEGKVGSITHTVDMNGSVRNEYDYDTFGTRSNVKTASSGSNQHFGYTGEMMDAESGLLYLRARYYDPSIGRFISADPYLGRLAQPVTQNRYIYVHNNPLLYSDPSGMLVPAVPALVIGGAALVHWARNYWNEPVSDISDVNEWTQSIPDESIYHTMGPGNESNRKFVSPDGRSEAVFDIDDNLVTDPGNAGTFNIFDPALLGGVPHAIVDVAPYFILGSSPSDMFNPQRFTATYDYLTPSQCNR
ncbi:MAG TPA: RHS repeat-associated core domain-containing protein [Chromatiales bacterium]|nr:RHS repeat-associated core domain-containing protein [Chromatiales bacterium]